jgi:hypothetical protein
LLLLLLWLFLLHNAISHRATQLLPDVRFTDSQYTANITLSPNSEYSAAFKVSTLSDVFCYEISSAVGFLSNVPALFLFLERCWMGE